MNINNQKLSRKGYYIVFEGTHGSGKSTQSKKLCEYLKNKYQNLNIVHTREPGGTPISESIRTLVQGTVFEEEMEGICEAYLYASARAQSLRKIVKPALEDNSLVISDRSFITSLSFQGFGRDLGIDNILEINKVAIEEFIPDCVIYLKADPSEVRIRTFDKDGDKFESMDIDFINKVEEGNKIISELPLLRDVWNTIEVKGGIDEVFEDILKVLEPKIEEFINNKLI